MKTNGKCPTCQNKRVVPCSCCEGRGWVKNIAMPPRLGKAYACIDCAGNGEIACPRCRPTKSITTTQEVRVRNARPQFGDL